MAAAAGGGARACRRPSPTAIAKFFPHRILPEAEISIYVDANTLILADLTPLIEEFAASGADIGLCSRTASAASIAEEFDVRPAGGQNPA